MTRKERPRRWLRSSATVGSMAAVVVGLLLVGGVFVVQSTLLDDATYTDALVEADAYERVYTEVLVDPELVDAKERMLGELDLRGVDPATVRIVTTNGLRWAVPPSTLQKGTEALIAAVLSYVRGDASVLDGDVDVSAVTAGLPENVRAEVAALLAATPERRVASVEQFRVAVDDFLAQVEQGVVPSSIPVVGGRVTAEQAARVLLDELGTDEDLRLLVETEVLAGDGLDALITLAEERLSEHAAEARAALQRELEDGRRMDVVGEISARAEMSRSRVTSSLDVVRDAARWFGPWTAVAGIVIVGVGMAALIALHRGDLTRARWLIAGALASGGAAVLGAWLLVRHGVESPLAPATGTGSGAWDLPAGMRAVLQDVEEAVVRTLQDQVARLALAPTLAAAALVVVPAIVSRSTSLSPARALEIGGAAACLVLALLVATSLRDEDVHECNGHRELCDRPYDEVVQAATHNSMSSPDVVTIWPEHDGTMRHQLDAGVRALLIDTHTWPPLTSPEELQTEAGPLPESVASAVFDLGGTRVNGRAGVFLCHNHCSLGAQELTQGLGQIRSFLDENPDEVVTLIVQDAISVADTETAFDEAGLTPYLYPHDRDDDWPTFGELIDRGERLVVFAENEGPPPSWYAPAFEEMQETPYFFADPADFTCEPNRGPAEASLFLMNHWVTRVAPDRKDSVVANRFDEIVDRARQCEQERGQLPDFIAVNFSEIGETVRAVDTLNGVG